MVAVEQKSCRILSGQNISDLCGLEDNFAMFKTVLTYTPHKKAADMC